AAGEWLHGLAHLLRLDRKHHGVGLAHHVVGDARDAHAELSDQPFATFRREFHDTQLVRVEAALEHAADERGGHVAAAEKDDLHAGVLSIPVLRARAPKIALPTRTSVLPSAIAASRSSDMPIDKVSSAWPRAISSSRKRRSNPKRSRCNAASGVGSGMHI